MSGVMVYFPLKIERYFEFRRRQSLNSANDILSKQLKYCSSG